MARPESDQLTDRNLILLIVIWTQPLVRNMSSTTAGDYAKSIAEAHGPSGHTYTADGRLVYSAYRDGGYELVCDGAVLTSADGDLTSPQWLDGRGTLLALRDVGGAEQHDLVEVEPETGSVTEILADDFDYIKPLQSPTDLDRLAFISTRDRSLDLYTITLDDEEPEPVKRSQTDRPVWAFDWAPDGTKLVYQDQVTEESSLRLIDLDAESDTVIVDEPDSEQGLSFVGTGHHAWGEEGIVFTTNHTTGYRELARTDEEGAVEMLYENEADKYDARWVGDGTVAFLEADRGDHVLNVYSDGSVRTVDGTGMNASVEVQDDDLVYQHMDTETVGDIYREGTRLIAEGAVDLPTVAPERVSYASFDGTQIPALQYTPAGQSRGAIVSAHGGPEGQHFNTLNPVTQTLVRSGFTVLAPDVRGSIGYGRSFRKASDGDLGGDDLKDLVAAADHLRDQGHGSVGLTGASYGGYMTLMGVGSTDAFDAGAAVCGVVNWETVVEDARGFVGDELMRKLGGTPAERPDFYVDRSPITYADDIDVPLLVVQGANDPRVPQSEAEQIVASLEDRDVAHEYILFEDEGHGVRLTENRIEYIEGMVSFFETHL